MSTADNMFNFFDLLFRVFDKIMPKKSKKLVITSIWTTAFLFFCGMMSIWTYCPQWIFYVTFFGSLMFVIIPMQTVQYTNLKWHWIQSEEYRRKDNNLGNLYIKIDDEWMEITRDNYAVDLWISNVKKTGLPYEIGGTSEAQKKITQRNNKIDNLIDENE